MSHPTNHGNGCSLEDCHTNLFALTDLDGIKWRRLDAEPLLEPLEDPVLQSFTKCIQADVLCVWRRVQKSSDQQRAPDQLICNKELCIFWYGEEPNTLSSLLSPDLKEVDRGSWDQGGLPYECRTLLFKALHNLIERCLLSQNFVRVGRWFVQPCEQGNNSTFTEKGAHLSIRFSFFLHGESQVCASIDVRQHTPLRRLQPFHLQYAQNSSTPNAVNVILAPYGLSGTLTGVTYKDTDFTQRLLDEWRQFYVLKDADMREAPEANRVPPAVEVIVAGVRMRYPSTFVLVTADIENEVMSRNNAASGTSSGASLHHQMPASVHHGNLPLTPPTSPLNATFGGGADTMMKLPPPEDVSPVGPGGLGGLQILSHRVMEKVWQDDAVAAGLQLPSRHHQQSGGGDAGNSEENVGVWDISDPTQKTHCACSKGKSGKGRMGQSSSSKSGTAGANKHSKSGDKPDKTSTSSSRHSRVTTPFHRRMGYTEPFLHGEVDLPAPREAAAAAAAAAAASSYGTNTNNSSGSFKGPMSNNPSIPTLGRPTNFDQSLDSPSSAAPSPLVATPREPSVSQNGDPTMPTLSPQRLPAPNTDGAPLTNGDTGGAGGDSRTGGPPSNAADVNTTPATPTSQPTDTYGKPPSAPQPSSTASTPAATPNPNTTTTTPPSGRPEMNNHSSSNHLATSPYQPTPTPPVPADTKVETVNQWLEQAKQQHDMPGAIKRPLLPTKTYNDHDEELVTESLYDFETLEAWLDQPMKRQKSHDLQQDLLKSHHDTSSSLTNSNSNSQLSRRHEPPPTPPSTTDDPYLFSDENSTNAGSFSKRLSMGRSREDSFPRPTFRTDEPNSQRSSDSSFGMKDDSDMSPPPVDAAPAASSGPLLTERDLKPTFNDLDKLFESSDSENSEPDPFPGLKGMDEPKMLGNKDGRLGTTDITGPTPTDLAVMYPTPPSLDNPQNPLSPVDTLQDQTILDNHQTILRTDTLHLTHLTEDLVIKDWSYVFKPPQHTVFLGSQLYKPIDLPSSRLPPLSPVPQGTYKPSWVYPIPMIEKHHHQGQSHYSNMSSGDMSSMGHKHQSDRIGGMMEAPSPATFMSTNQRTPMSYELQSPASNASSYMNKNMSSVDNTMHTNSQVPEVHSLAVNILLSDSILNLFKDHNFDSCTICVCNMNIKGNDVGVYLTDKSNEAQYRCTCGFSAVTNRKYGARSGLFYEDEVDITGIRDERLEQRKPRLIAPEHLQNRKELELPADVTFDTLMLLRLQFSALFPSASVLHHYYRNRIDLVPSGNEVNLLEIQDGCEACYTALEAGRQIMDNCPSTRLEDPQQKATCLHKWPYALENAAVPSNSQVVMRLLKSLQPLLQDTIQKKRGTMFWESVHTVSGPLTWKDFHLLAGRGADEASEPQPVPPIIVGYEKEWMSLSPYAFGFWDKLILEPYGRQRDVAYIVVAPDNDFILGQLLGFFKELSTVYELLKLGRHCPLSKTLRDGIMRVGKAAAAKVADEPVDEWFSFLGNSPVSAKLKLYAQVCQYRLAPYLARETIDKSLFENQQTSQPRPAPKTSHPEPSPQPATPSQDSQPATPSSEERGDSDTSAPQKEVPEIEVEQDGTDGPSIVIYMIDPFTYGADWDHLRRLSMLGLLRCYQGMLSSLPEAVLNNIQLQLVPLQTVLDFRESATIPYLKQLSMSVYTHCRRHVAYTPLGRSLTGFGPTACSEKILKAKDNVPGRLLTAPLFTPPFILASLRESELQLTEHVERAGVMFCAYCLSEDQRWLLVSVTDDRGELLETCTINIEIPNRNRRKKASARRIGLAKLWDFVLGVMSTSAMSWRLVVGRFGRMGHGELKGWAGLLSRKNLAHASKQLRDMCRQCGILNSNEVPCILSACLISMEVHQSIHIMTDAVKAEEKRSSNIAMSTPSDASCTHILVFPTSATAQPNAALNTQENEMDIGPDLGEMDDNLFTFPEDDLGDMSDLQMFLITPPSPGSPKNTGSAPGSPTRGGEGRSGSPTLHQNGTGKASQQGDPQDETPNLLQQPLAMGFYVSTSPSGPIPKWFWAACPHRQNMCPTCFKAALHIHCPMVQQNQDEFTHNTRGRNSHPLDSSLTCDVLRYVLETYNALSWLTMDAQTNERRSCLPAHFLVLLQLYHAIEAFV